MENEHCTLYKIRKIAEASYVQSHNSELSMMAQAHVAVDPTKLLPFDFVRANKNRLDLGISGAISLYLRMLKNAEAVFKSNNLYLNDPYEHILVLHSLAGEMMKDYMKRRKKDGRGDSKD
jgi:hypothetical protein